MQQFTVPQFIDVEDKIFGPITIRQFLIILAGGIVDFIGWRYGDMALFALVTAISGSLSLLFAFVKINGQAFHYFVLNIIQSARKPSLRVWKKYYDRSQLDFLRKQSMDTGVIARVAKKQVRRQHIHDLSLVVNTGGYYKAEQ